jgi:hypothetical protein
MQKKSEKLKVNSLSIGIVFLVSGIALFVVSLMSGSSIICNIGLGLTFWGALMLLIPPPKHVEASFLITSVLPDYMTIDRMLSNLISKKEAYNIPSCPRDIKLPEHLCGLKQTVTFIPSEYTERLVEIEDIARGKFLIERPKGLLITSPGAGLLDKIEQKSKTDFTKIPMSDLNDTLQNLLSELYLANEIDLTINENDIILEIDNSLYSDLYTEKYGLKSIYLLGCPLVNAAACAIAKSTGKPTAIQEIKIASNGKNISASIKIVSTTFDNYQKLVEANEKLLFRKNELLALIDASLVIVDLSFDILIGLQKKRIDWQLLEDYPKTLGASLNFVGQSMPPLNLDFLKISSAIKRQLPKETSTEAYNILKVINDYFDELDLDDDVIEVTPNFVRAKAILLSYYILNDLLLGKMVEDKGNKNEKNQLESILRILTNGTNFSIDVGALMDSIDRMTPETDFQSSIDEKRKLFKEQFKAITR